MNFTKTQLFTLLIAIIVIILVACFGTYFVTHEVYKPQEVREETSFNSDSAEKAQAAAVSARRTANSTRATAIVAEQSSRDADRSARDAASVSILRPRDSFDSTRSETK